MYGIETIQKLNEDYNRARAIKYATLASNSHEVENRNMKNYHRQIPFDTNDIKKEELGRENETPREKEYSKITP